MTEIFISYKKEDARRAEPIARALANAGYEVWWDHHIPPGRTYREVIGAALSSAKCVIVIWSTLSASAQWVLDEADEGKKRNVLLPLLIDDVEIPYGFRQIEAARLVGWSGDTSDPEWINMLASVSHFVGRAPGGPPRPFAAPSSRESPRSGAANAATGSGSREQRSLPWGPVLGVVVATALVGGGGYAAWRAGMFERQQPPSASDQPDGETPAEIAPVSALAPSARQDVLVPGDPMQTFFASGYIYCDAKLVAEFWGDDIGETKVTIGLKILNGLGSAVPDILNLSRQAGHSCEWSDTGYTYADAERLASIWGLAEPYQAKLRVESYVTNGQASIVDQALGR